MQLQTKYGTKAMADLHMKILDKTRRCRPSWLVISSVWWWAQSSFEKVQKDAKSYKKPRTEPRVLAVLQQHHAGRSACGNHKSKPRELLWKIRSSGGAGLIHHLAERLSSSCCMNWGKDKCGLLQWPLEASGHWHEAKMLCVCAGWEGAARRWHWRGKGSTGCTRIYSTKWSFSSVEGMCNCLILSTQECENTNNCLSLSTMGELSLRN